MKKNILVCISTNLGISKLICDNLSYYGFNVIKLIPNDGEIEKFEYPSILSRLLVKFKKNILNNKNAKKDLEMRLLRERIDKEFKDIKFDYSLFFLSQNFSIDLIHHIRNRTECNGMINYQWDGMERYPNAKSYINLFDRFFAFDPADLKYNLLPATNFYFDHNLEQCPYEYDFYFLGGHNDSRCEVIAHFASFAKKMNWNTNIQISCSSVTKFRTYYPNNVKLFNLNENKSFTENLELSKRSKVLLDFVINEHKGLSFRTFEALGHDKKLITTNKEIIKYDFYHPNNIFILDNNFDDIPKFLDKPYHHIDPKIKEKYSFGNWIKYVLNIEPHQPILLPRE